ncbi:MAG: hemerythrin family protein [Rhodospirillales bacterium]|nr:hemerythrin family protein [Rhodospirillales bacterium]
MMGRLNITEPLLIGHTIIDDEHLYLASLVNKSMDAIAAGSKWLCAETVDQLIEKLGQHFKSEERIMTELGFPETKTHSQHHVDCLKKLMSIGSRCETGDCLGKECVLDTVSLLVDDLIGADMAFKGHLQLIGYRG